MTTLADISAQLRAESQSNDSQFYSTVYGYPDSITEILERRPGRVGGERCAISLETAIDAANTYAEGDPLPASIEGTKVKGYLDWIFVEGVIQMTGHALMAAGPGLELFEVPDPDMLIRRVQSAIRKVVTEQAQAQVEYQVSASNAFPQAGQLSRVTYESLKSWVVNGGGNAVDADEMVDLCFGGRGAPYGCKPEVVVAPNNQHVRLLKLANDSLTNTKTVGTGGGSGLLLSGSDVMVGDVPVIKADTETTTIMLGLSGVRGRLSWEVIIHSLSPAGYDVLDLGAGENRSPIRSWVGTAFAVPCKQPNEQGLLYNLLA